MKQALDRKALGVEHPLVRVHGILLLPSTASERAAISFRVSSGITIYVLSGEQLRPTGLTRPLGGLTQWRTNTRLGSKGHAVKNMRVPLYLPGSVLARRAGRPKTGGSDRLSHAVSIAQAAASAWRDDESNSRSLLR